MRGAALAAFLGDDRILHDQFGKPLDRLQPVLLGIIAVFFDLFEPFGERVAECVAFEQRARGVVHGHNGAFHFGQRGLHVGEIDVHRVILSGASRSGSAAGHACKSLRPSAAASRRSAASLAS
jgi:hypothetical protein